MYKSQHSVSCGITASLSKSKKKKPTMGRRRFQTEFFYWSGELGLLEVIENTAKGTNSKRQALLEKIASASRKNINSKKAQTASTTSSSASDDPCQTRTPLHILGHAQLETEDDELDPPPPKRRPFPPLSRYQEAVPSTSNLCATFSTNSLDKSQGVTFHESASGFINSHNANVDVKEEETDFGTTEVPRGDLEIIEVIEDCAKNPAKMMVPKLPSKCRAIRKMFGGMSTSCPYCNHAVNPEALDNHIRKEHEPALPLFSCSLCSSSFKFVSNLAKHFSSTCHTGCLIVKKVEVCREFAYTQINSFKLRRHSDKTFTCPLCAAKLNSYGEVDKHIIELHGTNFRPVYGCSSCGNCEHTAQALFQHFIKTKCGGEVALIRVEEEPEIENAEATKTPVQQIDWNNDIKPTEFNFAACEREVFGHYEISSDDEIP